jgi:hypothetical protein
MFIVYIVDLPLNTGDFPVRNVRGYPGLSDPHRSLGPGNDRSSTGATLARPRSGCYWDPALQQFESAPSTRNKKTWTKKNCSETFLVVFGKWRQCIIYISCIHNIYIYDMYSIYIYLLLLLFIIILMICMYIHNIPTNVWNDLSMFFPGKIWIHQHQWATRHPNWKKALDSHRDSHERLKTHVAYVISGKRDFNKFQTPLVLVIDGSGCNPIPTYHIPCFFAMTKPPWRPGHPSKDLRDDEEMNRLTFQAAPLCECRKVGRKDRKLG